jgi:thiamine-phosphate diphosphorylase
MITDRRRLGQQGEAILIRRVAIAAQAGAHLVQIRERDMTDSALLALSVRAVEAVRGTRTRILVNDRWDVAVAAGAHGVHLRADSAPARRVRAAVPPSFLIGRSVHSRDEIARVRDEGGLDYLLFGTVFATESKPDLPAAGIAALGEAVNEARELPVLAVGGVTLTTGSSAGSHWLRRVRRNRTVCRQCRSGLPRDSGGGACRVGKSEPLMDTGVKTPLIDFFRRGDVAHDVRLQAAQGGLAARAHEQLALLALLSADPEPDVAEAANATLGILPRASLSAFLARTDVSPEMREFFALRGVEPAEVPAQEADQPIIDAAPEPEIADDEDDEKSAMQRLAELNVPQKMSRATKGTREERAILIRDPNKLIAVAVLSSPKLTDSEVEAIAKMSSVSEEILRIIATNRNWMKNYVVASALARNPKTPLAVSMNLLNRLNEKDLRTLSTNRNVPEVLRASARKKFVMDK